MAEHHKQGSNGAMSNASTEKSYPFSSYQPQSPSALRRGLSSELRPNPSRSPSGMKAEPEGGPASNQAETFLPVHQGLPVIRLFAPGDSIETQLDATSNVNPSQWSRAPLSIPVAAHCLVPGQLAEVQYVPSLQPVENVLNGQSLLSIPGTVASHLTDSQPAHSSNQLHKPSEYGQQVSSAPMPYKGTNQNPVMQAVPPVHTVGLGNLPTQWPTQDWYSAGAAGGFRGQIVWVPYYYPLDSLVAATKNEVARNYTNSAEPGHYMSTPPQASELGNSLAVPHAAQSLIPARAPNKQPTAFHGFGQLSLSTTKMSRQEVYTPGSGHSSHPQVSLFPTAPLREAPTVPIRNVVAGEHLYRWASPTYLPTENFFNQPPHVWTSPTLVSLENALVEQRSYHAAASALGPTANVVVDQQPHYQVPSASLASSQERSRSSIAPLCEKSAHEWQELMVSGRLIFEQVLDPCCHPFTLLGNSAERVDFAVVKIYKV